MRISDYSSDPSAGAAQSAVHSSDSEIRAAFAAFHRRTVVAVIASQRRSSLLSGGGLAFMVLALVGFGGGLFLASFWPNIPEAIATVTGVAPELIYARPPAVGGPAERAIAAQESIPSDREVFNEATVVAAKADADSPSLRMTVGEAQLEIPPLGTLAQAALPETTANFAAGVRLGVIGQTSQSGNGDPVHSGYDAVEVPSIPEPAAGAIIGFCLVALIASRQLLNKLLRWNTAAR